jgi:Domain of unknown function (DUF4351)
MTRIRFDQLAKQYLEGFLEPLGTVQRNLEVPGESKFVDVWFTPTSNSTESSSNLGLLSCIATTPCLLEPFRNAPTRQEVRSCLLKLLWVQEDQRRKYEQQGNTQTENGLPKLWILAATATKPLIAEFGGQQRTDWLQGIYFLPEALKTAIVAINDLPQTAETLWLRILGRDNVQQQAIAELLALPVDDLRRSRVLQLLVNWRIILELSGELEQEEQTLMTILSQAYLEWEQQTEQRALQRGLQQGLQQGQASLVLKLLTQRFGKVPEKLQNQIKTLSVTQLEELGEVLLDFIRLQELVDWLETKQQEQE